jgi:hypothetical protein
LMLVQHSGVSSSKSRHCVHGTTILDTWSQHTIAMSHTKQWTHKKVKK